jgi:hypothetical protein
MCIKTIACVCYTILYIPDMALCIPDKEDVIYSGQGSSFLGNEI